MNNSECSSVLQSGKVLYLGTPISLLSDKVFTGCNIFHTSTVFCQSVDFGALTEVHSTITGADFAQMFLDRFLGLKSFVPQNGLKDEFIADLLTSQGVDFQTILLEAILAVETSIAFAMHDLNPISYAAIERHKNSSDLIWGCSTPMLSRGAAKVALLGLIELLPGTNHSHHTNDTQDFDAAFNQLWQLARQRRLAVSTSIIKLAAKKRGIPCKTLGRQHLLLGHGKLQQHIDASMIGKSHNVVEKLLKRSFPPSTEDGQIPIVAVSGDRGTGSTARTLDMILRGANRSVALTLHAQSYVNGTSAELTQAQQTLAPLNLLQDHHIDTLVSTLSLRQTAKRGMLLEKCTVSIIMDSLMLGSSKLFQQGTSIIGRATTDCFVVGSGNKLALERIAPLSNRRLILVNDRLNDPGLQAHLNAGHEAVTTIWHKGDIRIALMSGSKILATFPFGVASFDNSKNIKRRLKNALMFAIAAAYGLGLSGEEILNALTHAPDIVPDIN